LLAAKAGASYVSPFVGRLDDIGHRGMDVVSQALTIYRQYGFESKIIAASLRHPEHVKEAAALGSHIATLPFQVFSKLASHPLTDIGLEKFLNDWHKLNS
jgi:transaldolase